MSLGEQFKKLMEGEEIPLGVDLYAMYVGLRAMEVLSHKLIMAIALRIKDKPGPTLIGTKSGHNVYCYVCENLIAIALPEDCPPDIKVAFEKAFADEI